MARHDEDWYGGRWRQHAGGPWGAAANWGWSQWGEAGRAGHQRGGPGAPPPWLAGLFGLGRPDPGRAPRVRRGDVRAAILDVLRAAEAREEAPNGYQVIQHIAERSGGAWRPSPGSVYPTIQQLQDEGLVELDEERGRRALRLTLAGENWCAEHAGELAAVWRPFERGGAPGRPGRPEGPGGDGSAQHADLKAEIGQVMSAVWQIVTSGSETQRGAAVDVLVRARRALYGILADGPDAPADDEAGPDPERDA